MIPGRMLFCLTRPTIGAAQLNSSLLTISVIAILLPAAFNFTASSLSDAETQRDILSVSHGVCILLSTIRLVFDIISRLP